jgi:hypothetical protein
MAETLGSLCDKLTIVKLKQYHSEDEARLKSLASQEQDLKTEIDTYLQDALAGKIPVEKLSFSANKVYKKEGNETAEVQGSIGEVFAKLAEVNCLLWHEQEKVYEFEKVPSEEKDKVVKQLAILNLERNQCMDKINATLIELVKAQKP